MPVLQMLPAYSCCCKRFWVTQHLAICGVAFTACGAGGPCSQRSDVRCHSSQGQHVQQTCPDISRLAVALQQEWDHAANAHLGNIDIKPYSQMKVSWLYDQCPDGHLHSWEARVRDRTRGSGCPQCSGCKVCKHNSLSTKAPLVAAQWDFAANDGTPDSVVAQSHQRVAWVCDVCGHKWSAKPSQRVSKKAGCPKGGHHAENTGRRMKQPTFADSQDPQAKACLAEWDHERNALQGNFPASTILRSRKQIFWLCQNCSAGQEHSWSARPSSRTGRGKTGCPFCAGKAPCTCNSLQALYPDVAADWDHGKNQRQPSDYTAGSTRTAWWSSPQRGSWQQSIHARTGGVQQASAKLKRIQQRQKSASQS